MTTKEKILAILERDKGKWFSGEDLAEETRVSRAAVWKAVKSLQNEGYDIQAVTNRGYCLSPRTDILSRSGILNYLGILRGTLNCPDTPTPEQKDLFYDLHVVPVTGSTNADVKAAAQTGAAEGYAVIAAEQTSGAGRRGRSFYSPSGTGVYISVLLKPENCPAQDAVRITTIAAVAACMAIENVTADIPGTENTRESTADMRPGIGERPGIKWVNDVYLRGKKVCGILTEGAFNMESALLDYAVLGIGFNVYEPEGGFPGEIAKIAGAVFPGETEDAKNRLCAAFLFYFEKWYRQLSGRNYTEEYRKRSIVTGQKIRVLKGMEYMQGADAGKSAEALAIDDDCRLLVRYEDGSEEWLSTGEISIRLNR